MNLKLPQLVALTGAIVLLYAAIKDVSPTAILKSVLTNQPLPTKAVAPDTISPLNGSNPVLPSDKGTAGSGDTSGRINDKGQYIPGDPNGAAPGYSSGLNPTGVAYTRPYVVTSV